MRSCNNCACLGRDCMVEPEDRVRAAEHCDSYYDEDEYQRKKWASFEATGEYWDEFLD